MQFKTVAASAAVLATLAVSPATAGNPLGVKVNTALRIARHADANATKALAMASAHTSGSTSGTKGDTGSPGTTGKDGAAGSNGADGTDGQSITGPAGPKGDTGPTGPQGDAGPAGPAGAASIATAENTSNVQLGSSNTDVVVVSFTMVKDGTALVSFSGQVNSDSGADAANCDLRVDGQPPADDAYSYTSIPAGASVSVAASFAPSLTAGQHTASFECRRSSQSLTFPAGRARLTVLS